MRLNLEIILAALSLVAGVAALPEPVSDALGGLLQTRACDFSDPCVAKKGIVAGNYCGFCPQVIEKGKELEKFYSLTNNGHCGLCGFLDKCSDGAKQTFTASVAKQFCPIKGKLSEE